MAGLTSKPVQFVFLLVAALASAGSSRPSGRQARGPQAKDEAERVKKRAVVRLENEWLEALDDNNERDRGNSCRRFQTTGSAIRAIRR